MKIRILTILITISMLLLLTVSCDNANSIENKTDETIADTENNNKTESETNKSQNSGNNGSNGNSNNNISGGEMGETVYLSFLDYEDYLQFSKGIFKEDSLAAQIIYEQFSNPKKSLIDVRAILDLPELTEKVHDQMTFPETNNLSYTTHLYNNEGRPNIE